MRRFSGLPILLASLLQLASSVFWVGPSVSGTSGVVIGIFRLATAVISISGSYHSVSGASVTNQFVSPLEVTARVGVPFLYAIVTKPYESAYEEWEPETDVDSLPPGLHLTNDTPLIGGVPTQVGVYRTRITAWQYPEDSVPQGVTNSSISASLLITILPAPVIPSITSQPADVTVTEGGIAVFSVGVVGTEPFTNQWYRGNKAIAGATSSTLTLTPVTLDMAGHYLCIVRNGAGFVRSQLATLNVIPKPPPTPPSFLVQPADVVAAEGDDVKFTCVSAGSEPITYQWYQGIFALDGQTNDDLVLPKVSLALSGAEFHVVASNAAGSTNSVTATLTVEKPIVIEPFMLTNIGITNGRIEFKFPPVAGAVYMVEYSDILIAPAWQSVTNLSPIPSPGFVSLEISENVPHRWFRVRTLH
jgi:hypothetical protein